MPYKELEQIVMEPTLRKTELYSTNHHRCTRVENPGGGAHIYAKIPEGARITGKIAPILGFIAYIFIKKISWKFAWGLGGGGGEFFLAPPPPPFCANMLII